MGSQQLWLFYNQLFISFFLFLSQLTCLHAHLCTPQQTSALLQLKGSFSFNKSASSYCDDDGITSFPKMESWKKGSDCCSWDGVDCDGETSQVIGLDLSCSWLQGTFHPNSSLFLSFPHLRKLNLAFNDFAMSRISPEFTRFSELTDLNLSSCDFSGKVPLEVSFLNKLVSLDLSFNYVSRLEEGVYYRDGGLRLEEGGFELLVQNLSKIRNLDLSDINMSSSVVPNSLLNLTSLRTLYLANSGLRGKFPSRIFHLPHLQKLDLGDNVALTGNLPDFMNLSYPLQYLSLSGTGFSGVLPDSVGNLKSLKRLFISACKFHGSIPTSLWNLTEITYLSLSSNNFSGILPSSISNLSNLELLDLSSNNFSGILPSSISNLSNLRYLFLDENNFSGILPSSISNLSNLRSLFLDENNFSGILPSSISNLSNLEFLSLSHNNFSGVLPSSISNLSNLEFLFLFKNNFSGILPSSISNLSNLRSLFLDKNNFSGILPSSISNLSNLELLDLSLNNFSGILPSSISNLSKLEVLELSSNNFTGAFFPWGGNLSKLSILDVSNNRLTGPLPLQVTAPPNLIYLDIGQNLINGTIPSWVFELPTLVHLNLRHNKLIGHTLEFQSTSLQTIDLSYNNLHGVVPNSTFELPNLTLLILSSNSFSGTILESNRFSQNLVVLELGRNNFSGTIHDSFTMRNSLKTIILNGNGFEGPIPESLVNCTKLEVLDLGRNKFFEKFPHWLGNLPNLSVLILRSNKLHGSILTSRTKFPFPLLRVLDLSNNHFTGPLPINYFKSFKAMMNVDEVNFHLEYMGSTYGNGSIYYDSLTIVIKGLTIEMEKILTIFTAIDLSRNEFDGEIPEIIGRLNSIRGLNLSHNSLTGHIPKSLGNVTKLEWLDLSSNKLSGEIPQQLTNLISLEILNLSQNRLTGPIPQSKQFSTFSKDSYLKNLALCGPPLSNACTDPEATQPPPSTFGKEEDSELGSGFCWDVILPGYGFGLVIGLVMGYLMFSFGKPEWLVKMVEGLGNRNGKRLKSNARRHGGRRN